MAGTLRAPFHVLYIRNERAYTVTNSIAPSLGVPRGGLRIMAIIGQGIAATLVGVVLLASSISKLRSPRSFVVSVVNYRVLPQRLSEAVGWSLPWLELFLGLCLVSGAAVRTAALATCVLLLAFIAAVGINLARGRRIKCQCFGHNSNRDIGWRVVVEDMVLVGCSTYAALSSQGWVESGHYSVFQLVLSSSALSAGLLPLTCCAVLFLCIVSLLRLSWQIRVHNL